MCGTYEQKEKDILTWEMLESENIGLVKKFIWVSCNTLQKNRNELLGQPNIKK